MQSFNRALGVECTFCHVDDKWADTSKPQWAIASKMRRMVEALNANQLADTRGISCMTCHGGQTRPARLPRDRWESVMAQWPASAASAPEDVRLTMSVSSASLGVACDYCHDPLDWRSAAKPAFKMVARMNAMFDEFPKYMPATARTQCYMCHKGKVTPG